MLGRESLEMKRSIHGHDAVHPEIATSLCVASIHEELGNISEAVSFAEKSLQMMLFMYSCNCEHPHIAGVRSLLNRLALLEGSGHEQVNS